MESVGLKSRAWAAQRGTKKTLGRLAAQSLIVMIHFPIPSALHSRALGQSGLQQPAAGADGNQLALLKPAAGRPMAITVTTGPGWGADTWNAALRRIEAAFDRAKDFNGGFDHLSGVDGEDEYRVPLNTGPIGDER